MNLIIIFIIYLKVSIQCDLMCTFIPIFVNAFLYEIPRFPKQFILDPSLKDASRMQPENRKITQARMRVRCKRQRAQRKNKS